MGEKMEIGSGNVFADLGHPDAELKLAKADLAIEIGKAIAGRNLTATAAATVLGTDQPKVSKILNGQLKEFSLERLATFLTRLNRDVEIHVAMRAHGNGRMRVFAKAATAPRARKAAKARPVLLQASAKRTPKGAKARA